MLKSAVPAAVAVLLTASPAFAQSAPPPTEAPPTAGHETPTSTTQDGAAIAPPAPGASPAKVEKAAAVAKTSALTPIIPSPKDPTRPAFQLYAEVDLPILGVGLVFASSRLIKSQPAYCAPLCEPTDLNALDRTTAGYWSPSWDTASSVGLYSIVAGAALVLGFKEGPLDALNDAVVVGESALSAAAVSSIMTLAAGRPRPFLYGTAAPLTDRNSSDAALSFLSGHTTVSFAVAMSTFMAMKRLEPKSPTPYIVLGVGLAASSFVGLARVEAGKHFVTDVLGAAIVGSSIGVLVPSLHGSPVRIVPVVSETERGLGMTGTF